jgi:hypothetical protein
VRLRQLQEIVRDVEIANAIFRLVGANRLTELETVEVLLALHVPRAIGVAAMTQARVLRG